MSSLFNHIFIPFVILFIFADKLKLDLKKIAIFSFFGIFLDFDIFLFHRASFHNIFILIIPLLAFIFMKDKETPGIIFFYLASALILDIFDGGVYLFYPFYDNVFFARTEIWFHHGFMPVLDYGISKNIMNNGRNEPMISSENFAVSVILLVFILISFIWSRGKPEDHVPVKKS